MKINHHIIKAQTHCLCLCVRAGGTSMSGHAVQLSATEVVSLSRRTTKKQLLTTATSQIAKTQNKLALELWPGYCKDNVGEGEW